jgi:hypothetical protein
VNDWISAGAHCRRHVRTSGMCLDVAQRTEINVRVLQTPASLFDRLPRRLAHARRFFPPTLAQSLSGGGSLSGKSPYDHHGDDDIGSARTFVGMSAYQRSKGVDSGDHVARGYRYAQSVVY